MRDTSAGITFGYGYLTHPENYIARENAWIAKMLILRINKRAFHVYPYATPSRAAFVACLREAADKTDKEACYLVGRETIRRHWYYSARTEPPYSAFIPMPEWSKPLIPLISGAPSPALYNQIGYSRLYNLTI